MEWLKDDLKRYKTKGLLLLACLALVSGFLLAQGTAEVATGGRQRLLVWLLLAVIVAKTSAQHTLDFFKKGTGVSFPEAVTFLAVVTLGPYHAALLGVVDMFLSCWRLRLKPTNYLINLSNISVSLYASGKVYYALSSRLSSSELFNTSGKRVLIVAVPVIAMALAYYVVQFAVLTIESLVTSLFRIRERIRDTFPWEPGSPLAWSIVAGLA